MKTRNEIYQGEGAKLLRFITTYHTLRYDQVLQLFSRHEQSIKSLITSLIKQGRIIYDKEHDLLCDSQQSAENPDHAPEYCESCTLCQSDTFPEYLLYESYQTQGFR